MQAEPKAEGFPKTSWAARQEEAALSTVKALNEKGRTQIHWFCGTGKTKISILVSGKLEARRICVIAPTLALLHQHWQDWWSEKTGHAFHGFCSALDLTEKDEEPIFPGALDKGLLAQKLAEDQDLVLFTTYQSLHEVGPIAAQAGITFDLAIFDEAHRTAGKKGRAFGFGLDAGFPTQKRLFLTATPKYLDDDNIEEDFSMEDETLYGPVASTMPYREAQELGILCDYTVLVADLLDKVPEKDELPLVAHALLRIMKERGLKRAISYHSRVDEAYSLKCLLQQADPTKNVFHVNGYQRFHDQKGQLEAFKTAPDGIITNARCLCEGVNIPAVDLIFFADPMHTDIGIIQAIGRALRKDPANPDKIAYIVIPTFGSNPQEFRKLNRILHTLRFADPRVEFLWAGAEPHGRPKWLVVDSVLPRNWDSLAKRIAIRPRDEIPISSIVDALLDKTIIGADTRRSLWKEIIHETEYSFPDGPKHPLRKPLIAELAKRYAKAGEEEQQKIELLRIDLWLRGNALLLAKLREEGLTLKKATRVLGITKRSLISAICGRALDESDAEKISDYLGDEEDAEPLQVDPLDLWFQEPIDRREQILKLGEKILVPDRERVGLSYARDHYTSLKRGILAIREGTLKELKLTQDVLREFFRRVQSYADNTKSNFRYNCTDAQGNNLVWYPRELGVELVLPKSNSKEDVVVAIVKYGQHDTTVRGRKIRRRQARWNIGKFSGVAENIDEAKARVEAHVKLCDTSKLPELEEIRVTKRIQSLTIKAEAKLKRALDHTIRCLDSIYLDEAKPQMVERLVIKGDKFPTMLKDIASITTPDRQTIHIRFLYPEYIKAFTEVLRQAKPDFTLASHAGVIRMTLPPIAQGRLQEFVTEARRLAEDGCKWAREVQKEMIKLGITEKLPKDKLNWLEDNIRYATKRTLEEIEARLDETEENISNT